MTAPTASATVAAALVWFAATTAAASRAGAAEPAAAGAKAPAAQGVRYLYLIRHGHYDRVDSLDERTANGLSRRGHAQAKRIGKRLTSLPVKPRLFVSSDLLRAVETAAEIGAILGRTATVDTLIAECASPSSRPGFDAEHDAAELAACQSAMEAAWAKYAVPSPAADAHDILVCHGNVIRWFTSRAVGNDTRNWTSYDIGHASLTVIAVRPDGGTRLVIYSDVGHLPVSQQTWAGRGAGWGPAAK
ncbi:MAG TPA: histidine phosphatase family protein [Candidatus Eisenbacteria bacterium]|nr:histidine phosphatase family protein [Candidatus Eisenbacteria bacterium]